MYCSALLIMSSARAQNCTHIFINSWDIWENVIKFISAAEQLLLAASCWTMNNIVCSFLGHRLLSTLHPFIEDPSGFLSVLWAAKAVISGSFVVDFIFGTCETEWHAADLDICVSHQDFAILLDGLFEIGFLVDGTTACPVLYCGNEIESIVHVSDDSCQLNIIVSRRSSCITPLFQNHSSLLMNYVTANSFFSGYPRLSSRSLGFVNPLLDHRKLFSPEMMLSLEKYRMQGFTIRAASSFGLLIEAGKWCFKR